MQPFMASMTAAIATAITNALWYIITRMPGAWPKAGVVVSVANTEAIQDLIRDKVASYGLDRSMDIPTTGTVAVESAPKTIGDKDYTNYNLGNFVSFLDKIHQVTLVDVRSFRRMVLWRP